MEGKILALERSDAALQTEVGALHQMLIDAHQDISDAQQLHATAMNQVVDQAKDKFEGLVTTANQQSADIQMVVNESRKEFGEIKKGCEDFGNKVEKYAAEATAEREGIKAVINNVVAGYGQEIGAVKQRISDLEQRIQSGSSGHGIANGSASRTAMDHRNGFKGSTDS